MRTLIPILFLVLFWSDPGLAAWEDSPECPARMAVTRQATRDFYRGFALPGASAEQILELLERAEATIGPSREACAGPDEQESLEFQLLEFRQIAREIRKNRSKSPVELAPVATRDG